MLLRMIFLILKSCVFNNLTVFTRNQSRKNLFYIFSELNVNRIRKEMHKNLEELQVHMLEFVFKNPKVTPKYASYFS
jgi:hypothetical protein